MTTSPYVDANAEMLAEVIRQAEARLDAQLTAALGADQRAMTFAGLLLAGVGALLGGAFGMSSTTHILGPVIAVALIMTVAFALAVWSAQPTAWEYVGNVPSEWLADIASNKPLHQGRAEMAEYYDQMIATNEAAIGRAARLMKWSIRTAMLGLIIGILGAAIFL